jgi:signal transduction histidine kinase/CheY-like chemotaxis protein
MGICHSSEYNNDNHNYDNILLEYNVSLSNATLDVEITSIINKFEHEFAIELEQSNNTIIPFYVGMLKRLCIIRATNVNIVLNHDMIDRLNVGIVFIHNVHDNHMKDTIYYMNKYISDITGYNSSDFNIVEDWFTKLYPENYETVKTIYLNDYNVNFLDKQIDIYITTKSGNPLFFGFFGCKTEKSVCWVMIKKENTLNQFNTLSIEINQLKIMERLVFDKFNRDFMAISSNTHFFKMSLILHKKLGWSLDTITNYPFLVFIHKNEVNMVNTKIMKLYNNDCNSVDFYCKFVCRNDRNESVIIQNNSFHTNGETTYIFAYVYIEIYDKKLYWIIELMSQTDLVNNENIVLENANEAIEKTLNKLAENIENNTQKINNITKFSPLYDINDEELINTDTTTIITLFNKQKTDIVNIVKLIESVSICLDNIRNYYKLTHGIVDIINRQLNLKQFLKRFKTNVTQKYDLTLKNIKYKYYISDNVPATITTDDNKLMDILLNIFDNSFKYIQQNLENKIYLAIYPISELQNKIKFNNIKSDNNDYIVIEILDTGIGMSQSTIYNTFKPFYSTNYDENSYGLGLTIVKNIVLKLNGDINIESIEGQSTSVYIALPFINGNSNIQDYSFIKISKTININERHILQNTFTTIIVDDVVSNLRIIERKMQNLFESYNYMGECIIKKYTNGNNLIDELPDCDLFIIDIIMPEILGTTLIKKLREKIKYNNSIIVCMTSTLNITDIDEMYKYGVDAFMLKPLTINNIKRVFNNFFVIE